MTKYFCDGCKTEISGNIYHVKIYVNEKSKSSWEKLSEALSPYTTATNCNANETTVEIPMYCQKCKEKIENFIACGL